MTSTNDPDLDFDDEGRTPSRKSRTIRRTALIAGALLLVLVGVLATRRPASERPVTSALLEQPVPDVSGPTTARRSFDLKSLRGQWVLVNFFATWCTACVQEHPELKSWSEEHRRIGDARLVMVVFGDDPGRVRTFFKDNGGDWPAVEDPDGSIAVAFGVTAPPESYLVAPDGTVKAKLIGPVHQRSLNQLLASAKRSTR